MMKLLAMKWINLYVIRLKLNWIRMRTDNLKHFQVVCGAQLDVT